MFYARTIMQEKSLAGPGLPIATRILHLIKAQVLVYLGELEATERKYKEY